MFEKTDVRGSISLCIVIMKIFWGDEDDGGAFSREDVWRQVRLLGDGKFPENTFNGYFRRLVKEGFIVRVSKGPKFWTFLFPSFAFTDDSSYEARFVAGVSKSEIRDMMQEFVNMIG